MNTELLFDPAMIGLIFRASSDALGFDWGSVNVTDFDLLPGNIAPTDLLPGRTVAGDGAGVGPPAWNAASSPIESGR